MNLASPYPQYLVLLVLWETDKLSVNDIAHKLILNTNTITPLLKRMEKMELLTRKKTSSDERKVIIQLSEKGNILRENAACIPSKLIGLQDSSEKQITQMKKFQHQLVTLLNAMREAEKNDTSK